MTNDTQGRMSLEQAKQHLVERLPDTPWLSEMEWLMTLTDDQKATHTLLRALDAVLQPKGAGDADEDNWAHNYSLGYAAGRKSAELEAMVGAEWQPIETAPTDGTTIWLAINQPEPKADEEDAKQYAYLGHYDGPEQDQVDQMGHDGGFSDDHYHGYFMPSRSFGSEKHQYKGTQPTHWKPYVMPELPALSQRKGDK